jgi:zinc-binding alcohol dehydrogenase/oxidoreductase
MKALVLHEIGGPDKLSYEDAPDPEPGSGETVVCTPRPSTAATCS